MSDLKAERADTSLPLHTGTGQLGERKKMGCAPVVACARKWACAPVVACAAAADFCASAPVVACAHAAAAETGAPDEACPPGMCVNAV